MASKKEMEAVIRLAGVVDPSLQKALQSANKEISRTFGRGNKSLDKMGKSLSKFGSTLTKSVTLPLVALAGLSFKTFMDMEKQLNSIQATLNATPAQMDRISSSLKTISNATKYSALDAAKAFDTVVKSGKDAAQSMLVVPAALRMASATGKDVGEATQFLTDSMRILEMDAEEINVYLDQMTVATKGTGLSFDDLHASLQAMGPDARRLKGGTVELSAALATLTKNNIEGKKSGLALTNIINALADPSKEGAKALEEMGVTAIDAAGDLRPLNEIFAEVQAKTGDFPAEARRAKLTEIFGANDIKAVDALLTASAEDFVKLENEIQHSALAAQEMADVMESGAAGAIKELKSEFDALILALGENIAPSLTEIVKGLTGFVNKLNEIDPGTLDAIVKGGAGLAAAGPALKMVGGALSTVGLKGPLLGIAKTALLGIAGTPVLPLFLVAGGITAVVLALKAAHDAEIQARLDGLFGDIHVSTEDLKAIAQTARTTFADAAANALEVSQSVEQSFAHLKNLDTALTIDIQKIPVGKELNEQQKNDLKVLVDSYVYRAQKYLEEQQFAITLGITEFALAGTDEEQEILGRMAGKVDEYFAGANEAAAAKGKELRQALDYALADGVIDAEEQKTIDRLRSELAQIINSATILDSDIEMGKLNAKIGAGGFDRESITELNKEINAATEAAKADINALADQNLGINEALFRKGAITRDEADEYAKTIRSIRDTQLKEQDMWAEEMRTNLIGGATELAFDGQFERLSEHFARGYEEFIEQARREMVEDWGIDPEDLLKPEYASRVAARAQTIWNEAFGDHIDRADWADIAGLYQNLLGGDPGEALRQYKTEYEAAGQLVPEWITEGLKTWDMLDILALGDEFQNVWDKANMAFEKLAYEPAVNIEVANINEEAARTQREIEEKVRPTIDIALRMAQGDFRPNMRGFATGGRAAAPSIFGEDGPEWAIPEERSVRSAELLNAARAASGFTWTDLIAMGGGLDAGRASIEPPSAEGAGALSQFAPTGGGGDITLNFSPEINIQGGGSPSDTRQAVMDALDSAYPQFVEMLQRYITDRGRESYGTAGVHGLALG